MRNKNKEKKDSIFIQEVRRDIHTFQRLDGKRRAKFIWDYYKWKILAAAISIMIILTFANLLWQGQKPYRLRVCAVLNNDQYCDEWFGRFFNELSADGVKGALDLDQDQPFDYDNVYYYVQEIEVRTKVASRRIDVAVCGPDLYQYLLAINACMPLDTVLPHQLVQELLSSRKLVRSTANLAIGRDGTVDGTDAVDGYFAIDLSDTSFGHTYNDSQKLEDGEEKAPLYAIILSNTDHLQDSIKLAEALLK